MLHLALQPREIVAFRPRDLANAVEHGTHPELLAELAMYSKPDAPYVWQALEEGSTIKLVTLALDAAASFLGAPTCTPASLSAIRAARAPHSSTETV